MTAISYPLRSLITSSFFEILFVEFEACSRGDLELIKISRMGIREKNFSI